MVAVTTRDAIAAAQTVIVKIGTSLLVDEARNAVNAEWLAGVPRDSAYPRR